MTRRVKSQSETLVLQEIKKRYRTTEIELIEIDWK